MTFDPLDKKWQISPDFPPDKTDTWKNAIEDDGWVLAHDALRAEMTQMIEAIEAAKSRGACQEWEVACIQQFWNTHYIHIHSHHSNEDVLMVPVLETRFNYPDKFVADHDQLVAKLDKVAGMVKSLGQKEGDSVDELLTDLKEYEVMMLPHLKAEEVESLPLMRAYFTKAEIGKVTQSIVSKSPKVELGSFIMCMGVDKFRNDFMKQEGIPCFVWYLEFKGCVAAFEKEFNKPIKAIKSGAKPVEERKSFCFF